MTFQQLQYILEIEKTGSLTAAAKNLIVASSSVSACLNLLEKELGYPLFVRTPNSFKPTPKGAQILDYARQICHTHEALTAVGQEQVRVLRINSTDQVPISKAIGQLLQENKDRTDLRIECVRYTGSAFYQKLVEHVLDLGISTGISYSLGYWERKLRKLGLHQQVLKIVPAAIQVGPGHRLAGAKKVYPHQLYDECFVDDPRAPLHVNEPFANSLYVNPEKVLYISGGQLRREAILQGLGYGIGMMPPKGAENPFCSIPLEGCFFQFSAITYSKEPVHPQINRLLQLVRENLDEAYPEY